jgi:hypothetical protein
MLNRLKKLWRGVPTQVTETERRGWRITYQDPTQPPARDRIRRQMHRWVKWMVGIAGSAIVATVIGGLIVLAIGKLLGLS